ncbi:MAG: flavodoxin family protein [ANME-2 cluster archaeon]|jgi:multimeric flavodoxin WrbA|nr:flavodoxin family protein [ANME-2 cluster archaeon]
MKVIAFNGSPRKKGNTAMLINSVFDELQKEGIETEFLQLGGKDIKGCLGCMKCFELQNNTCVTRKDDIFNEYFQKMIEADGIIIGSPTYFSNVSSEVKALIDRAGLVSIANGYLIKHKVGAAVVAVRRAGATDAFDAINKFFLINQVIVPGSIYWNMGFGFNEEEVRDDEEGMNTMKVLGENMAWLLKKIMNNK